jgi:HNH endonuclease
VPTTRRRRPPGYPVSRLQRSAFTAADDNVPAKGLVAVSVNQRPDFLQPSLLTHVYDLTALPAEWQAKIRVDEPTGDWLWAARLDRDGYGRIGERGAHRVIYEYLAGPIPPKLVLDHVVAWGCCSRSCVNPAHHQPVTHAVNVLRGRGFTAINARKTECDHGHKFTPGNTYWWADERGHRRRDCRICIRGRVHRYRRRLAEATRTGRAA